MTCARVCVFVFVCVCVCVYVYLCSSTVEALIVYSDAVDILDCTMQGSYVVILVIDVSANFNDLRF